MAVRRDAQHLAAAIERGPVAAVRIDRAAVGAIGLAVPPRERPRPRRRSRRRVEVVGAHDVPGRVGVVHRPAVGAPREAVADHHAVQDRVQRQVGVQAPEAGGVRVAPLVHRADEEAALRVAAPVVEAVVRGVERRAGDRRPQVALPVGEVQPVAQRDDEPAALAQGEAPDRRRHRHRRVAAGRGVEAVQRRGVDVDPVQHRFVDRPHRTLAEARAGVEHATEGGVEGHRDSRGREGGAGLRRACGRRCASYKITSRLVRAPAFPCRTRPGPPG